MAGDECVIIERRWSRRGGSDGVAVGCLLCAKGMKSYEQWNPLFACLLRPAVSDVVAAVAALLPYTLHAQ